MTRVWTHGRWIVEPGNEDRFVEIWSRLARDGADRTRSGRPTLLRDRDEPNVFVTFGWWSDPDAVEAFRRSSPFRAAVAELEPLLRSFEPSTLDEVEWA